MSFNLMLLDNSYMEKQAVSEIMLCNEAIEEYALVITEDQAMELVETRSYALKNLGRIEFGGGTIEKLILGFAESPYISQHRYAEFVEELIEIFYYYKNETLDLMSDDDLIRYMKKYFDGVCKGSLEQLKYGELNRMARNIRFGYSPDFNENNEIKEFMEMEEENE